MMKMIVASAQAMVRLGLEDWIRFSSLTRVSFNRHSNTQNATPKISIPIPCTKISNIFLNMMKMIVGFGSSRVKVKSRGLG
jgi:hypothetical protein